MAKKESVKSIVRDIRALKIQGASQVRKAVVRAVKISVQKSTAITVNQFRKELKEDMLALATARPTEPETRTAIRIILKEAMKHQPLEKLKENVYLNA